MIKNNRKKEDQTFFFLRRKKSPHVSHVRDGLLPFLRNLFALNMPKKWHWRIALVCWEELKRTMIIRGESWVLVVLVLWLCCIEWQWGVQAEQMRWRYPGKSGLWLDPHNWIGQSSGLPRVPGPSDDVVLSDWSFEYGPVYTVTLEVKISTTFI